MPAIDLALYLLEKHEGFRQFPYKDQFGKLTIGYGRCLDTRGITEQEAAHLLRNDVLAAARELTKLDFWVQLNDARRAVLIDMAVNLGIAGLMNFEKMIAALRMNDFTTAAKEMLSSEWAKQLPARAKELSQSMRSGLSYADGRITAEMFGEG
jgi:lysozyme